MLILTSLNGREVGDGGSNDLGVLRQRPSRLPHPVHPSPHYSHPPFLIYPSRPLVFIIRQPPCVLPFSPSFQLLLFIVSILHILLSSHLYFYSLHYSSPYIYQLLVTPVPLDSMIFKAVRFPYSSSSALPPSLPCTFTSLKHHNLFCLPIPLCPRFSLFS